MYEELEFAGRPQGGLPLLGPLQGTEYSLMLRYCSAGIMALLWAAAGWLGSVASDGFPFNLPLSDRHEPPAL